MVFPTIYDGKTEVWGFVILFVLYDYVNSFVTIFRVTLAMCSVHAGFQLIGLVLSYG